MTKIGMTYPVNTSLLVGNTSLFWFATQRSFFVAMFVYFAYSSRSGSLLKKLLDKSGSIGDSLSGILPLLITNEVEKVQSASFILNCRPVDTNFFLCLLRFKFDLISSATFTLSGVVGPLEDLLKPQVMVSDIFPMSAFARLIRSRFNFRFLIEFSTWSVKFVLKVSITPIKEGLLLFN